MIYLNMTSFGFFFGAGFLLGFYVTDEIWKFISKQIDRRKLRRK